MAAALSATKDESGTPQGPHVQRNGHRASDKGLLPLSLDDYLRLDGSEKKGGRKQASFANPQLVDQLKEVVDGPTAGSPGEPGRLWTNRSPREIAEELGGQGISVSANTARRLLRDELGLSHRALAKTLPTGASVDRQPEFERMLQLRAEFLRKGWPVLSMVVASAGHKALQRP